MACLALAACSNVKPSDTSTYGKDEHYNQPQQAGVFSKDGLLGVFNKKKDNGGPGVGVNSFLWRASLDTLSFLPLTSADPFGGVIITDWHSPPGTPDERFKVTIYILSRQLNAASLKAAVFRQTRDSSGNWVDAAVDDKTPRQLEDEILTDARQLRISSTEVDEQK